MADADLGDPECCGFLYGLIRDGQGYIESNDCDAAIRRVPADQLRQTLNEMEAGASESKITPVESSAQEALHRQHYSNRAVLTQSLATKFLIPENPESPNG